MRVRALDGTGDFKFGRGTSDYKVDIDALAQNIQTRLKSFLGDCFFDLGAGVDWFNLLGSKNIQELKLVLVAVILNTENVISCTELIASISSTRNFLIQYSVNTVYGEITNQTLEV